MCSFGGDRSHGIRDRHTPSAAPQSSTLRRFQGQALRAFIRPDSGGGKRVTLGGGCADPIGEDALEPESDGRERHEDSGHRDNDETGANLGRRSISFSRHGLSSAERAAG
jgi:hypothetical protein